MVLRRGLAPPDRLPRLVAVVLIALAGVIGPASVARAHPFGIKPVLFLTKAQQAVTVQWVAQPDELRILSQHLQLGPLAPAAMAERDEFISYFTEKLNIETPTGPCEGTVFGAAEDPSGAFAVAASYACPVEPDEVTVRMTMLQDVDDRYVNLLHATTNVEPVRGAFTSEVTRIDIDFVRAEVVASGGGTGESGEEAGEESRADRIIAALQGVDGSISLAVALGLAFLLGLFHGVTPGHGKTIAAAYLVGAGGTMRQALALGGVVTLTHALSTGLIAAIPIALGETQPPPGLSSWLEIAAGLLIVGFGALMLRRPLHDHAHGPTDPTARALPLRRLAGIGLIGGLVPNPEALLVVLVAFSLHRWTAGAALIGAFSVGLGLVVLGIAVASVKGGGIARRMGSGRFVLWAPRLAAVIFLGMGVVVVARGAVGL